MENKENYINKIKKPNIKYLAKNIKHYDKIDSTHIRVKEMGKNKEKEITMLADMQTAGIGTKGRSWNTGKGKNIAMSILLYPKCKISDLDGLTIEIAEIMKKVINKLYGYKLEVKEPNDLLLNGKKICGILTEINTIGEKINFLIISLGFNVNENKFPKDLENIATSLKREYKIDFEREEIISNFLEELEINLIEKKII